MAKGFFLVQIFSLQKSCIPVNICSLCYLFEQYAFSIRFYFDSPDIDVLHSGRAQLSGAFGSSVSIDKKF